MGIPIIGDLIKGSLGETIKDIAQIWKVDPTVVETNRAAVLQKELELEAKAQEMFTRNLEAVNATMREESKSEHWLQWAWRPICGLTLAGMVINNYILMPYFGAFGVLPLEVPEVVWQSLLAVVGVSALTRGLAQAAGVWKNGNGKVNGNGS